MLLSFQTGLSVRCVWTGELECASVREELSECVYVRLTRLGRVTGVLVLAVVVVAGWWRSVGGSLAIFFFLWWLAVGPLVFLCILRFSYCV